MSLKGLPEGAGDSKARCGYDALWPAFDTGVSQTRYSWAEGIRGANRLSRSQGGDEGPLANRSMPNRELRSQAPGPTVHGRRRSTSSPSGTSPKTKAYGLPVDEYNFACCRTAGVKELDVDYPRTGLREHRIEHPRS